jgi:hypothetical protein
MPFYMTQTASAPGHPTQLYYRKQPSDHVSHAVSGAFSNAVKSTYATTFAVTPATVVLGGYQSGQGVPRAPNAIKI